MHWEKHYKKNNKKDRGKYVVLYAIVFAWRVVLEIHVYYYNIVKKNTKMGIKD